MFPQSSCNQFHAHQVIHTDVPIVGRVWTENALGSLAVFICTINTSPQAKTRLEIRELYWFLSIQSNFNMRQRDSPRGWWKLTEKILLKRQRCSIFQLQVINLLKHEYLVVFDITGCKLISNPHTTVQNSGSNMTRGSLEEMETQRWRPAGWSSSSTSTKAAQVQLGHEAKA